MNSKPDVMAPSMTRPPPTAPTPVGVPHTRSPRGPALGSSTPIASPASVVEVRGGTGGGGCEGTPATRTDPCALTPKGLPGRSTGGWRASDGVPTPCGAGTPCSVTMGLQCRPGHWAGGGGLIGHCQMQPPIAFIRPTGGQPHAVRQVSVNRSRVPFSPRGRHAVAARKSVHVGRKTVLVAHIKWQWGSNIEESSRRRKSPVPRCDGCPSPLPNRARHRGQTCYECPAGDLSFVMNQPNTMCRSAMRCGCRTQFSRNQLHPIHNSVGASTMCSCLTCRTLVSSVVGDCLAPADPATSTTL